MKESISKLETFTLEPDFIHQTKLKHLTHWRVCTIHQTQLYFQLIRNFQLRGKKSHHPVAKFTKYRTITTNYWPISFTNILSKTLQKIVAQSQHIYKRTYNFENELSPPQYNKSTIDNLIQLEEWINLSYSLNSTYRCHIFRCRKIFLCLFKMKKVFRNFKNKSINFILTKLFPYSMLTGLFYIWVKNGCKSSNLIYFKIISHTSYILFLTIRNRNLFKIQTYTILKESFSKKSTYSHFGYSKPLIRYMHKRSLFTFRDWKKKKREEENSF